MKERVHKEVEPIDFVEAYGNYASFDGCGVGPGKGHGNGRSEYYGTSVKKLKLEYFGSDHTISDVNGNCTEDGESLG